MKQVIVAVLDLKVTSFARPFFVASVGVAMRSFADEVNRNAADNIMFHHPSDFVLYELGVFDDEVGKFNGLDGPKIIAHGSDVKT